MNAQEHPANIVDGMLDAMASCFTPETLEAIAAKQWAPEVMQRLDELATKANEGLLTPDERAEYEQSISVSDVFSMLRLKAQLKLKPAA